MKTVLVVISALNLLSGVAIGVRGNEFGAIYLAIVSIWLLLLANTPRD